MAILEAGWGDDGDRQPAQRAFIDEVKVGRAAPRIRVAFEVLHRRPNPTPATLVNGESAAAELATPPPRCR